MIEEQAHCPLPVGPILLAFGHDAGSRAAVRRSRQAGRHSRATGVMLAFALALMASTAQAASADDYRLRSFEVGGDFELTNQHGGRTRLGDLRGKVILLFFGFTNCADVCPTIMVEMRNVLRSLEARADSLRVVFISIDPERDNSEHLKKYVSYFHEDIIGLTGSEEELARVADMFDARFAAQPHEAGEAYAVDHSSFVFLLDQDGSVRYVFPYGTGAEVLTDGVTALLASR